MQSHTGFGSRGNLLNKEVMSGFTYKQNPQRLLMLYLLQSGKSPSMMVIPTLNSSILRGEV